VQQAGVTVAAGTALVPPPRAVLFDLDGTLIDSAPDLAGAVNDMRASRGRPPVAYATLRAEVGSGARGMVRLGFGLGPDDDGFAALRAEFLACYDARKTRETSVFPAMRPVLAALDRSGVPWGIVTNKAGWLAEPLIAAIGGLHSAATLVCGDTMSRAKPHPDPLLEAARRMAVPPEHCLYVGDDLRDMQAGRAAGMRTVAAAWGYLGAEAAVTEWQADAVAADPAELSRLLGLALPEAA
jgi:phosphoglycolate phosphatase